MTRKKRMEPVAFPPVVAIDTREQAPFTFRDINADGSNGGMPIIVQMQMVTLAAGDYSIWGHHIDGVSVERKSLADLFGTLGQGRDRFVRELERLSVFRFAAVVVEADWNEVIHRPPSRSKLKPKTVFRSVIAWQQRYPIHWWFLPGRRLAEVTTFRILERYWRDRQREGQTCKEADTRAMGSPTESLGIEGKR